MVYPYVVKYKGEYYEAGEEIFDDAIVTDEQADEAVEEEPLPFSDAKTYTKSEIRRMTTADLQNLAESLGIENARETSGSKLKEKLIEYYGL